MIFSENHITQHHFFRIKNTELNEIYVVMSIRSFIISTIGVFIPIYLYTAGLSVQDIALFYIIMFGAEGILHYPSALLLSRLGPKHNIALSLPILVFHLWQLWTIEQYHFPLWTIAVTGSITLALYWTAYHYDFSKAKTKKKASKQVSRQYIIIAILGAIAPFIGGSIAEYYGFSTLFGVVTLLMLLAVVPLFKTGDKHPRHKFNPHKVRFDNYTSRQLIAVGASAVEATTQLTFWPLLVYLVIGNYQKIGIVTSSALILTIVTTYYVGKRGIDGDRCKYIRTGSFLTGLIHIFRPLASSILHVFGFNLLNSFTHAIFMSPLMTEYYLHADENSRLEYIYYGEAIGSALRVMFLAIIYALGLYFPDKALLTIALILGGLVTMLMGIMPKTKCEIIDRKIKVLPKLQKVSK